jgi:hypothetical protein
MSGFPRPVFPGDFQAVKFYDLPDDIAERSVDQESGLVLGRLQSRNIVPGHLYEVVFGPIYVAYDGTPSDSEAIDFLITVRAPGDPSPDLIRRQPFPINSASETIPQINAYFVATVKGDYGFAVVAQHRDATEGSELKLSLDNSIFGVRGVASTDTDFTIQTTPEV